MSNIYVDSFDGMIVLDPSRKIINMDLNEKAQIPLGDGKVKELDVFTSLEEIKSKLPMMVVFLHITPDNKSGPTEITQLTEDNYMNWILGESDWKFVAGKKVEEH